MTILIACIKLLDGSCLVARNMRRTIFESKSRTTTRWKAKIEDESQNFKFRMYGTRWDRGVDHFVFDRRVRAYVFVQRFACFHSLHRGMMKALDSIWTLLSLPLTTLYLPAIGLPQLSRLGNFRVVCLHLHQSMTVEAEEIWCALKFRDELKEYCAIRTLLIRNCSLNSFRPFYINSRALVSRVL